MFDIIARKLGGHKCINSLCMIIPAIILSLVFVSFLSSQSSYTTSFSSNGFGITPAASAAAGAAAGASAGGSSFSSPSPSSSAAASASAGGNTIIRNEQTVINRNVIDSLVRSAEARAVTTSPSSTAPLVDLETVKLGRSIFSSNGLRPLADVIPFRVIGGHVSLTSPKNVKLVAATITGRGVEHAVIIDLAKVRDIKAGESLYQTDLGEVISGTNLFTGRRDTVSNFTDLLLWNNSNSPVLLTDDSQVTMDIVYQ